MGEPVKIGKGQSASWAVCFKEGEEGWPAWSRFQTCPSSFERDMSGARLVVRTVLSVGSRRRDFEFRIWELSFPFTFPNPFTFPKFAIRNSKFEISSPKP